MSRPKHCTHVVKAGETLAKIALREYGSVAAAGPIADANHIDNPRRLMVGLSLRLPDLSHGADDPYRQFAASQHNSPDAPSNLALVEYVDRLLHGRSMVIDAPPAGVLFPTCKYPMELMKLNRVIKLEYEIEASLVGEVSFQILDKIMHEIDLKDFAKGEPNMTAKAEYEDRIKKIGDQIQLKFDPKEGRVELVGGIAVTSKLNGHELITQTAEYNPITNTLSYKVAPAPLEGEILQMKCKGELGFKVEVRLRRRASSPDAAPVTAPFSVRDDLPNLTAISPATVRLSCAVVGTGLIIAATIASSPITVPAGVLAGFGALILSWDQAGEAYNSRPSL